MNVVRRAVSAGSLTLACACGFVLLDAPAAHAEECTGLVACTTKDVGDTVRKAAEGDVEGTVEKAGKTVGDTVDRVTKTAGGDSGGSDGGDDSPEPPAAGGGGSGKDDSPDSGSGSGDAGTDEKKQKRKQDREKAKERRSAQETRTAGQDTSMWVSLQQWAQPQPRLALAELMRDRSSTASLPVTTTVVPDRRVPPPEVAPPPAAQQPQQPQQQQQHQERQRQEPRYLTVVPAADERSPGGPQQLPRVPVFAATALAGTAGMAVLSVYQRRRKAR